MMLSNLWLAEILITLATNPQFLNQLVSTTLKKTENFESWKLWGEQHLPSGKLT